MQLRWRGPCAGAARRQPLPSSANSSGVACRAKLPARWPWRHAAASAQSQALIEQERALVAKLSPADLAAALTLLEDTSQGQPDEEACSAEVLERLIARRVSERARVVRFPLRFTTSGARRGSRRYLTVPVDVEGLGFTDFCLDAGTWSALITPEFRARLGLNELDGAAVRALNSSGPTIRQRVPLPEMWLGTHLLPQLHAYVSRLPAAQRKEVGGLLGVKVLRRFDIDINFDANEVALHPAGHVATRLLDTTCLHTVACKYTKAGLVCMPVSINGSVPFLGILDLSAALSIMNWEAAALVGMQCNKGSASSTAGSSGSGASGAGSSGRGGASSSGGGASSSGSSGSSSNGSRGRSSGGWLDADVDAEAGISSSMEEHIIGSSEGSVSGDSNYGFFGLIKVDREPELIRPATPHQHNPQHTAHNAQALHSASNSHSDNHHDHPSASHTNSMHSASNISSSDHTSTSSSTSDRSSESDTTIAASSSSSSSSSSTSSTSSSSSAQPLPPLRLPPELRDPAPPSSVTTPSSPTQQPRKRPPPTPQSKPRPRPPPSSSWADNDDGPSMDPNVVRLQVHRVRSSQFRVKLGLDRLGGSMLLQPPPAQVAVSALKGLQQLGLAGRPAMVIGHDIWARRRVVLSVKAGVLYMADAQ